MQGQTSNNPPSNSFDRFKEYEAVLLDYASVQGRRQAATNLFLTINVVYLGALGLIALISHLNSWWAVGALGALALAIMPVNITWYRAMLRYEKVIFLNYTYIQDIEAELRLSQADKRQGMPNIGLYLRHGDLDHVTRHGAPRVERELAVYFLLLYPGITALAGILTYLVMSHVIPPLILG